MEYCCGFPGGNAQANDRYTQQSDGPNVSNVEMKQQEPKDQMTSGKKEKVTKSGSAGKNQDKQKAGGQETQGLDTSALLKKKDQRKQ